jgi:hypothetical protein
MPEGCWRPSSPSLKLEVGRRRISAAIRERHANAQPCFIPLKMNGRDAGGITLSHACSRFEPMVRAARAKIGGTLRTPLSVAMMTDQSVPMMTTKSIAASVCPNQRIASGTQQTLGSVCKPSASTPSVSSQSLNRGGQQSERQASRDADHAASQSPSPNGFTGCHTATPRAIYPGSADERQMVGSHGRDQNVFRTEWRR